MSEVSSKNTIVEKSTLSWTKPEIHLISISENTLGAVQNGDDGGLPEEFS